MYKYGENLYFCTKKIFFTYKKSAYKFNMPKYSILLFFFIDEQKSNYKRLSCFIFWHSIILWLIKSHKIRSPIFDVVLNSPASWLIQFHLIFFSFLFADFIFKYLLTFSNFLSWFSEETSFKSILCIFCRCTFSHLTLTFSILRVKNSTEKKVLFVEKKKEVNTSYYIKKKKLFL